MASRMGHPLNGAHTAGIYSDSSVDGPEIGTLIVIVDRAKNLPNRKTIGKQDPYCAARLGKEAKKTTTDIRGGQTPRWDQELRFTVHDSPDYYQLKLSVFNDDRKTELIGETWIDLKNIIVAGGGQADLWQSLSCRGKYSGEIRIEITYYDSRRRERTERAYRPQYHPVDQPEAPVENSAPAARGLVKRRPLPTDPQGPREAPAVPTHRSSHASLRKQPSYQSPSDFGPPPPVPPLQRHAHAPADPYGASPGWQNAPPSYPSHRMAHARSTDFGVPPAPPQQQPQQPQYQHQQPQQHQPQQRRHVPNAQSSDFGQSDQRDQRDRVPDYYQQFNERRQQVAPDMYNFNTVPNAFPPFDSAAHEPPVDSDDKPPPPPVHRTRFNSAAAQEAMMRNGGNQGTYDPSPRNGAQMRHDVLKQEAHRQSMAQGGSRPAYRPYDSAPAEPTQSVNGSDYSHQSPIYDEHIRSMQPTVEDAPESPQTRSQATFHHNSLNRRSVQRSSLIYEVTPDVDKSATPAPLNLSSRNSVASRQSHPSTTNSMVSPSVNNGPGNFAASPRPSPRPQEQSAPSPLAGTPTTYHPNHGLSNGGHNHQPLAPSPTTTDLARSPAFDTHYSTSPGPVRHGSFVDHEAHKDPYSNAVVPVQRGSFAEQKPAYDSYAAPASPAPPVPARRGSFMDQGDGAHLSHSPGPLARRDSFVDEHTYDSPLSRSPVPARRPSFVGGDGSDERGLSPVPARSRRNSAYESYENALVHVPSVPPSLVPGVDPESAAEISNQIYGESRLRRLNSQYAMVPATTRARAQTEAYPYQYRHDNGPSPSSYSPSPYSPSPHSAGPHSAGPYRHGSFDARSPGYDTHSPGPAASHSRGRSPSPMPSPMPSPRPSPTPSPMAPPQHRSGRQSVSPAPPLSTSPAFNSGVPFGPDSYDALNPSRGSSPGKLDAAAKILSRDGREIDPSDHLPVESWAPEPEPKQQKQTAQEQQSRVGLAGGQPPPPPSGRRQLRIAHRPSTSMSGLYHPEDRATPSLPPPGPGRGRLQKKSSRTLPPSPSPAPPPSRHSHSHSPSPGYRDPQPSPHAVPRTTTWDYANDATHAGAYGTSPGAGGGGASFAHRASIAGPPQVPPASVRPDDWALMQEISQIDLGAGRSTRRNRGY